MHFAGADLHFNPFAITPRNRGVNAAIAVVFGLAQIVFEPPRNRAPALVDHPQDAVTITDRITDHPKAVDVGQPRERQIFLLHLAPDRIGFLRATINIGLDVHLFHFPQDIGGDLMHHIARLALQGQEPADDGIAGLGVDHAKRQIFQFFAHPLHAHATCQGGIDFHGFTGFLRLLVHVHRLDRAHIVQPVAQFHQNNPQILGHRHEQLAEILGLLGFG